MDEARIAELVTPFLAGGQQLSPTQMGYISIYIDLLLHWNARINLTSVREPEEIVTRHFGESLFAARHLFPTPEPFAPHVIDVGSGPGFPGLPIKIWAPQVRLTLIESNHKKATFLREVVRSLGLADVDVFAGRAETFAGAEADVVTLRAVERLWSVLPIAAGLMSAAGRLAILIGESQVGGVLDGSPRLKWDKPIRMPLSDSRVILLGSRGS